MDVDDIDNKKQRCCRFRRTTVLRLVVFFIMCALMAALGAASFILLRQIEISTFQAEFQSSIAQLQLSVQAGLANKFVATRLIEKIYGAAVQNGYAGTLPFLTLPGFQAIAAEIITLASLRAISWNPMVNGTQQRLRYEAWTKTNIVNLGTNVTGHPSKNQCHELQDGHLQQNSIRQRSDELAHSLCRPAVSKPFVSRVADGADWAQRRGRFSRPPCDRGESVPHRGGGVKGSILPNH